MIPLRWVATHSQDAECGFAASLLEEARLALYPHSILWGLEVPDVDESFVESSQFSFLVPLKRLAGSPCRWGRTVPYHTE